MAVIAMITFHATEGNADALATMLAKAQRGVTKAGCKRITLLRDQTDSRVLHEFELWDTPAEHQAMIAAAEKAGAFDPIKALLAHPMQTSYLLVEKETVAPE